MSNNRNTKKRFVLFAVLLAAMLLFCGCKTQANATLAAVSTTADLAAVTETVPAAESTASQTPQTAAAATEAASETASVTEAATSAPVTQTAEPVTEAAKTTAEADTQAPPETEAAIDEDGSYYSKDDVALYLHVYGHLPGNFVTKKEAQAAGWTGGSVEAYFPGCAIGGDYFGNYEGLLPKKKGRSYYECDIDTLGKRSRGAKRIIYSNDGYIYYTDDHYESFTELYRGGAS